MVYFIIIPCVSHGIMYRVFIKYCVFSKNFKYFAISPWPTLGWYWLYRKWPANTIRSHNGIKHNI